MQRRAARRAALTERFHAPEQERKVRPVEPTTHGQKRLATAIDHHSLTIAIGPAGSGKTCLAISAAAVALDVGDISRIVLSRPAVDAGENLGALPGSIREKMAPWLRPLYDELQDRFGNKRLEKLIDIGNVEIVPVGMMRGRTLKDAFIVIDEAQNLTYAQLKMVLTRIGHGSTMVITGDPGQSDIETSGLGEIARRLAAVDGIAVVELSSSDIVRHHLVESMLKVI